MHRFFAFVLFVSAFLGSGCAIKDALWTVFGDGYTAGGATSQERRLHYEKQTEGWGAAHSHYDPTSR